MEPMLAGFLPLRAVLLVAIPALYLVAGLRPGGATADFCFTRARAISTAALLSALLGLLWLTVRGPAIWPGLLLLPLGALGSVRLSVRSDLPSGIVLLLVSFLGWVIVRYSQPYLCGDGGERRYLRWLLVTLGAVALLIITNNLGILLLSWVGVSLALHRLLTFYGERPLALLAARKKFLVSRLAEVFLAAALIAVGATLHTLEIDAVLSRTAQLGELPAGLRAAALCVAISAALKCAQLPVHGWLIQVMEAPTPVSALLHAGVVNLGGFLLIRLSGLVAASAPAQWLLVLIGSLTAVLAALVTLTRVSVKVMLAWSTCAQLGFMLMECGLGAYDLALLHLVAHSLYKAHSFLSAGSAVEQSRLQQLAPAPVALSLGTWLLWGLVGVGLGAGSLLLFGISAGDSAPKWAIVGIVGLSVAPLLSGSPGRGLGSMLFLGSGVLFVVLLHQGLHGLLGGCSAPPAKVQPPTGAVAWALLLFLGLFFLQGLLLARPHGWLARKLYAWFFGGLYLDELFTRLTLRLWGGPLKRSPDRLPSLGSDTPLACSDEAPPDPAAIQQAVERACQRIAPTWPLDRFIAVNPYWGFADRKMADAAAELLVLSGARMLMPRSYYREQWQAGRLRRAHLDAVAGKSPWTAEALIASLHETPAPPPRLHLITDLVDTRRDLEQQMAFLDYVVHSISQFCAAWFDSGQAVWKLPREKDMYTTWRRHAAADRGPHLLMGFSGFRALVRRLPESPQELIVAATQALRIPAAACDSYFAALLLNVNGWAAFCAYERWQARLAGDDDDQIVHLLAIRLAWEWLLAEGQALAERERSAFFAQWRVYDRLLSNARVAQQPDWLLQQALERAYQEQLCHDLIKAPDEKKRPPSKVQAVFCIDVRSEPFRRALESCAPVVQTAGFAGFFGLPIDYTPLGTALVRPQLPGLLFPRLHATDATDLPADHARLVRRRHHLLEIQRRWRSFRTTASSAFCFVESCGLFFALKLLKRSLLGDFGAPRVEQIGALQSELGKLRPTLEGGPELVDHAEKILRALGLTELAPLVLLCGHGSTSVNNPHAAALDCGACGGQRGEVNARLLAGLLNATWMRMALRRRGIRIPDNTWFLAGLHDTTTDEVQLFDLDCVPSRHRGDLAALQGFLAQAGVHNRARRAAALGIVEHTADAASVWRAFRKRAGDWAQVRPEWGLAENACLIVAPRRRTRHLDLGGRAFLHDYEWSQDEALQNLELVMTAPMIVTSWINLQYYASTVDKERYGSGNKVLHNVVGGHLGVFEGNSGDLRIGLPVQSIHDGTSLRHAPLRLCVFIEAPRAAIETVMARSQRVRELVDNDWLHLFQIDAAHERIARYQNGCWTVESAIPGPPAATDEAAA